MKGRTITSVRIWTCRLQQSHCEVDRFISYSVEYSTHYREMEHTPGTVERFSHCESQGSAVHKLMEKNVTVTISQIIKKYSYCGFRIDEAMLSGRLLPIFENKKEPPKCITMKIDTVYFLKTLITIT
jgi:hypothetical protein